MPRKKNATAASPVVQETPLEAAAPKAEPAPPAVTAEGAAQRRSRSFKTTLSVASKGVTLGVRDGHDWVVAFPEDPGKEAKDQLQSVDFEYRDRKWKVFTHAPNRAAVAAVVRELKERFGDDMTVNEYPVKQVVIAFPADPGPEVTEQLKANDFHFRSDATWNADFNDRNQDFARSLAKSLPDVPSVGQAR